ncbi:MAG: hypothetical protein HYV26_12285 [Candidatus Hydrogenedentes bacterium]|nr:hypothetical protein [Candidatus Hydrogenedentota bacterium]
MVSVEGRESNLEKGKFAAKVFGLDNIEFYQDDVNNITLEKYGRFDAILCMGILYHIAQNKYLDFLKNLSECTDLLIIDSFIALHQDAYVERDGVRYLGTTWREHDETTTLEQRLKSAHSSLDNAQSFTMTRECLLDYLEKLGFTTVMEAVIPKQPSQPEDRPTLVCRRGSKVSIRVFPEFNYEKDFSSAMDSRGIQGRNVVFWNLPKEGDQKPSFVSLNQNIDPAIRSPRSAATLRVYDHCLDALRASPVNVLELGTREAGSLVLLAKYFPAGNVLGLGVAPLAADAGAALSAEDNKRVKFASGKLADKTFVAGALNSLFGDKAVDIVIDNASHLYKETRDVYEHVFTERLRGGGLYVIEGWGCGYWPKWADGNPDGLHGLPLFIKELVDEVAKVDRTKLYKAERALAVADVQSSTIDHLYIAPGVVVVQKA